MARADGRVQAGQRLTSAFSARAWNRAQDAADIVLGDRGGLTAGGQTYSQLPSLTVLVRNDTGFPVPILGVVRLSTPIVSPIGGQLNATDAAASRAKDFFRSPVFRGVNPGSNSRQIAIYLEPVAAGAIGRAAVSGVTPVKLRLPTFSLYSYASTLQNDRTQLVGSACGPVRLLWHDATQTGDDLWGLALL